MIALDEIEGALAWAKDNPPGKPTAGPHAVALTDIADVLRGVDWSSPRDMIDTLDAIGDRAEDALRGDRR